MNPKMNGMDAEITNPSALSSPPTSLPAGTRIAIAGTLVYFALSIVINFMEVKAKKMLEKIEASGIENAPELAASYNQLQFICAIWACITVFCGGLMLWAVFRYKYRAQWLYWVMLMIGFKNMSFFPVGSAMSIALLLTATIKRKEFGR